MAANPYTVIAGTGLKIVGGYLNEQGYQEALDSMRATMSAEDARQRGFWDQLDAKTQAMLMNQAFAARYARMIAEASKQQAPLDATAANVAGAAAGAAGNAKLGAEGARRGVAAAPVMARSLARGADANDFRQAGGDFGLDRFRIAQASKRSMDNLARELEVAKQAGQGKRDIASWLDSIGGGLSGAGSLFG